MDEIDILSLPQAFFADPESRPEYNPHAPHAVDSYGREWVQLYNLQTERWMRMETGVVHPRVVQAQGSLR